MKQILGLSVISLILLLFAPSAFAAPNGKVPEKLVYDLSWSGISVGTATQEITENGETRKIVSTARSSAWLSTFFPVEDRTESILDKTGPFPGLSRTFRMQIKEGKRTRDREFTFNQAALTAQFHDRISGDKSDIKIVERTFDIYSSFYYVRYLDLTVGKPIYLHVLDGKEIQRIEVRVLRKERISIELGKFNTIVVEPIVKPEGVFEEKGGMTIWLTDDERRIPVMVKTKVKIGKVTAELTEFK